MRAALLREYVPHLKLRVVGVDEVGMAALAGKITARPLSSMAVAFLELPPAGWTGR